MRWIARVGSACGLLWVAACGRTDLAFASAGEGASDATEGTETDSDDLGETGGRSTASSDTGDPSATQTATDPTEPTATDPTATATDPTDPTTFTATATDPTDPTDTEGPIGDCTSDTDCVVPDPCEIGRCDAGFCVYELRDLDDDGFAPYQCSGTDCNDLNPTTYEGAPEACFDGDDNDCNGVADCFDPACDGPPNCGCDPEPGGEVCTSGEDEDCDAAVDCNDTDCMGTPECGCTRSEAGLCVDGFDDDCDAAIDCDDSDCTPHPACECGATPEQCSGGNDDDCDLLVDCADPDCDGLYPCTCVGAPSPEQCNDGEDDDCDELVDCADPDCFVSPACDSCAPEDCDNGEDDDCDGVIDCADDACAFAPNCAPTAEACNNDLDDDNDGLVDCEDPDCTNAPICAAEHAHCQTALLIPGTGSYFGDTTGHANNVEGSCGGGAGEAVFRFVLDEPSRVIIDSIGTSFDSVLYVKSGSCTAGAELGCDDDSGGFNWSARLDFKLLQPGSYFIFLDGYTIDPFGGPNEGPYQLNVEVIENPPEICDDETDNDGDVYADCADAECLATAFCASCLNGGPAEPEFGVAACTDGADNDCDGDHDCDDDDCSASDYYVTECCDGVDENDNGIPDDFNCRCNNDSECDGGQICYDHTANACGIPCDSYFGDICPFVAPGSTCNDTTAQCEF